MILSVDFFYSIQPTSTMSHTKHNYSHSFHPLMLRRLEDAMRSLEILSVSSRLEIEKKFFHLFSHPRLRRLHLIVEFRSILSVQREQYRLQIAPKAFFLDTFLLLFITQTWSFSNQLMIILISIKVTTRNMQISSAIFSSSSLLESTTEHVLCCVFREFSTSQNRCYAKVELEFFFFFEFLKINDKFNTRADPLTIFDMFSTFNMECFLSNISQEFFISEIDFLSSKISSSLMDNWILIWWRKNWFEIISIVGSIGGGGGKLWRMMECFSVRV